MALLQPFCLRDQITQKILQMFRLITTVWQQRASSRHSHILTTSLPLSQQRPSCLTITLPLHVSCMCAHGQQGTWPREVETCQERAGRVIREKTGRH